MKKIALLSLLGLFLFVSCISGPQPGEIALEKISYVQYGAEDLPDVKASYINFISENYAQISLRNLDNVDLYEMINGASSSYGMINGSKIKMNETIKMIPGEHSFDLIGFTNWGNIHYTLNIPMKLDLKPGFIYYIYPAESTRDDVHDNNQFIADVYVWPVGEPEKLASDTIVFELNF